MPPFKMSLKAARVNAGMTQRDLAVAVGLDRSTIQKYESGKSCPNWDTVDAMSKIFGVPVDYIFFGKRIA
jgi:DNA-binding XRE family transcriptional regulator